MGTAIKHPVPDRVKPSFVIFDIRALWRSGLSVKNYKWRLNPVWHWMLYSCSTHMATVGVKGLKPHSRRDATPMTSVHKNCPLNGSRRPRAPFRCGYCHNTLNWSSLGRHLTDFARRLHSTVGNIISYKFYWLHKSVHKNNGRHPCWSGGCIC